MGESSQSLTDILRIRTDVPVLGAGNEGTVREAAHREEWAIKEFHPHFDKRYATPEFMQATHYFTKILHTLFPKNIPDHYGYVKEYPYKEVRRKVEIVEGGVK